MSWRWVVPGLLAAVLGLTMVDWPGARRPSSAPPAPADAPSAAPARSSLPPPATPRQVAGIADAADEQPLDAWATRAEASAPPAALPVPAAPIALPLPAPQLDHTIRQVQRVKQQVEEQFSAVRREREALKNELEARRQQVQVLERRVAALSQQMQQQAESLKELSAARRQADEALAAARVRLEAFEQDPLSRQVARLQHKSEEAADLQQALKAQEQTSRQLNKQLTQSAKQVAGLSDRIRSRESELSRLERELTAVKTEQSRLTKENRKLTRALERAGRKPWEGFERLFGQSQRDVHAGKGLFALDQASVQQVLARARDQVEQLADAVEDRDQVIAELQTALAEQERRLEQADAVIALLEQGRR